MLYIKKIIFICIIGWGGLFASAQSKNDSLNFNEKISGNIYDAVTKLPLEGLNVSYNKITSVFTDSTGSFELSVPNKSVAIVVSGAGYQTQIIPAKQRNNIEVFMHEFNYPSSNQLYNDFYSGKPVKFTPKSVTTISSNTDSWKNPGLSLESIIKGRLSGLNIIERSGIPGIGSNMFLRGYTSLYGTNQPLIVIDGFIFDSPEAQYTPISGYLTNSLAFLDITDIENISLIKDASNVYGSRAGSGVLFITTQRSRDVATKIFFNGLGGINFAPDQLPVLETDDYRRYLTEILQTSGLTPDSVSALPFMNDDPTHADYYRYHNNMNWQDQIFSDGVFQKYNLRISGGDDIALYTLSVGYAKQDGIIKNTGFNRYNARFNSDIQVSPKFVMNAGVSFAYNNYKLNEEGLVKTSPIYQSLFKSPSLYPYVRGTNGVISPIFEGVDILGVSNPNVIIKNVEASSDNYQIFGILNAGYKLTDDFSIDNQIGIDFRKSRNNLFVPHHGIAPDTLEQGIAENKLAHQVTRFFKLSNDFRIAYNHIFNSIHHVSATTGMRLGLIQAEDDWGESRNSPNDEMKTINTGSSIFRKIGGDLTELHRLTYYATAEYNYAHRYLVSFNMALDGNSNFGKESEGLSIHKTKFGIFPSAAVAWLVSSEKFMASLSVIDLLKLRTSYGINGNSDVGDFPSRKYYVSQNFIGSQGLVQGSLWTPHLQWETVTKMNIGADLGIFNSRIVLNFDYFRNVTTNLLNIIDADPLSGHSVYINNDGSFQSQGFDVSAFFRAIDAKNLKWDFSLVFSKYKTEILELPQDNKITTIHGANIISSIGKPLGVFYGYKTSGVYSTKAEAEANGLSAVLPNTELSLFGAGDVIFEDLNNDNIINENDMQVIGDPNPDFFGMINNKISWKGISLETVITFTYGQDVFNHLRYQLESMQNTNNQSKAILNRWQTQGQITDIPKATAGDPLGNSRFSDRWIEDGSYLRLKYITLSYDIPWRPLFFRGLEVFVTGENLLTFTNYLGYDPEFSISQFSLAQGIDIGLTPQVKSIYAGIKMNF